ncbi:hypothetical protein, partial [Raoultella terrigena]|uniref:hypothetical protein n=1 Tax=Raoultella terrigena TaxID=577 RepID=UPI002DB9562E
FQDGDDLVLSESDLTHSDLLRGHNQYVGRSLKVNGPFWWDTYISGALLCRIDILHQQFMDIVTLLTSFSQRDIVIGT